jgi:HK97 gp10 family phage protein
MSDGINVKIQGLELFKRGLQSLPEKMAQQLQYRAIGDAAKFLRQQIIQKTPIDKGWLIASIKVKGKKIDKWSVMFRAGSYFTPSDAHPAWYAHIVEFGARYGIGKNVRRALGLKKKGKEAAGVKSGIIPAQPFVRPAWDANATKAQEIIADRIGKGIARAYKKLGKNPFSAYTQR